MFLDNSGGQWNFGCGSSRAGAAAMVGVFQPNPSCERGLLDWRRRDLSTGVMSERLGPALAQRDKRARVCVKATIPAKFTIETEDQRNATRGSHRQSRILRSFYEIACADERRES